MNYGDLLNCRCALPFDLLGVRELRRNRGRQVTCWFSNATKVTLLDWINGESLPHKTDPFAFCIDQFPSFATRIYDHQVFQWQDRAWQQRSAFKHLEAPLNIYEIHLGSWRFKEGRPLS